MEFNEVSYSGGIPVDGYGPGFFRVAGEVHRAPILILPEGMVLWNGFGDAGPLQKTIGAVDVLFVGMGAEIAPVPAHIREMLEAAGGPGLEVMASPTACRTYNVLLSEGRRVGLAALPV
ncbi:MAG: Mth938-like domain-containing protein [Pseudomonadota bacterium]